jgi:hypothetical protein
MMEFGMNRMATSDPIGRADLTNAITHVGVAVRYTFYVIGAMALGVVGLFFWSVSSVFDYRVKTVNEGPSFHLAAPHLQRLNVTSHVLSSKYYGRMEIRQYGQLYDRDVDLTVALVMPPAGTPMLREFGRQLRDIRPMQTAQAVFGTTYFDIQTRFGPVRATDLRVQSDGMWKLCLAYLSRFESLSVYITGWYCDQSGAKPSAERLACTLDRLTLDKDLASKEAEAFLRSRLSRPASCSAEHVSQTTDVRSPYDRRGVSSPQRWSTPSSTYRRY